MSDEDLKPTKESLLMHAMKQGPLFVILCMLLYFMFNNSKEMKPVMESNTKVIGANSVVLDKAITAGEKNNEVIKEAVDYMKSRRGR